MRRAWWRDAAATAGMMVWDAMQRVANMVIGVAIVVIAGSVAALLYLMLGFSLAEAGWIGLAVLLGLFIVRLLREREDERRMVEARFEDLAKATGNLTREITLLHGRVVDLETRERDAELPAYTATIDSARLDTLETRLGDIEALGRSLTETMTGLKRQAARLEKSRQARQPDISPDGPQAGQPTPAPRADVPAEPRIDPRDREDRHHGQEGRGSDDWHAGIVVDPGPVRPAAPDRPNGRDAIRDALVAQDAAMAPETGPVLERSAPFVDLAEASLTALVDKAVRAGRVEIMLQPIVTLPQRKVRFYEAFARLRTADGVVMQPGDFLDIARRDGMMAEIDRQVVRRAVHVARRLISRNREVSLFVNLDLPILSDSDAASEIVAYLDGNKALSNALIFEVPQHVFEAAGPLDRALLDQISELGFRLALDQAQRLDVDGKLLAESKVRFLKVAASKLLYGTEGLTAIHPADLSDLLARFGLSLIATHVEREAQVVDLLDYDVGFAQGFLFSPPRPVRGDTIREGAAPDSAPRAAPDPVLAALRSAGAAS